jgi:hypothetical protein
MAIDNTPPRLRLIATIAFIVVVTLVGLDFVFKSYYAYMSDEAVREKLAPRTDLVNQLAAEKNAFAAAKVPVDQAMAQLAKGQRGIVTPQPSEDMGPMTGWSKMPKPLPYPEKHAPAPTGADHTTAPPGGDAGAAAPPGDAGPAAPPGGDAGAGKHPAPHPGAADAAAPHPPGH